MDNEIVTVKCGYCSEDQLYTAPFKCSHCDCTSFWSNVQFEEWNNLEQSEDFVKHDSAKNRYDLIPPDALDKVVKILTLGAEKYGDSNWQRCSEPSRYFAAAQRHLWAWKSGEKSDSESDVSHLAHAVCSLLFMLELDK